MKKLLVLTLALAMLSGQEADFKSSVRLVQVYATVFDHGGRTVPGLTREQFEVHDDGAPQPISVFEPTEKAISCALLLDTTGSMTEAMPNLRNAARQFIDALREGDSVGVYAFNDHLNELAEMASDKNTARKAITRLRASGQTALFDSITQLALLMDRRQGKKVIVVFTDGGDNASSLNRQAAVQRARKAGVPIFAVAEGEALHDQSASTLLHELAESTGGHLYRAETPKEMDRVFQAITADLQNSYLLAFAAPVETTPPLWHQLQVNVRNAGSGLRVRARTGYPAE